MKEQELKDQKLRQGDDFLCNVQQIIITDYKIEKKCKSLRKEKNISN